MYGQLVGCGAFAEKLCAAFRLSMRAEHKTYVDGVRRTELAVVPG